MLLCAIVADRTTPAAVLNTPPTLIIKSDEPCDNAIVQLSGWSGQGVYSVTFRKPGEKNPVNPSNKEKTAVKLPAYDWYTDAFRRFSISKLRSDEQLKHRNVAQHAMSITFH